MGSILCKEHYDLMQEFENFIKKNVRGRLDNEPKDMWSKGLIYQDGLMNERFLMFRVGYECGRVGL